MKDNQSIRVAHVIGKWVGGGVEAVIMNYYKNIDRNLIQFDFLCDMDSTNIPYEEIENLGGKVILTPPYQNFIKYQRELIKIFKANNYKIVHSHINSLSVFPLRAAKKARVPVRIAHSHSTTNKKEWKKNLIKNILKPFSRVYANEYFACSEHAARWLFGNRTFEKGKVFVLNNAINVEKFKYNEEIRKNKRIELGIKNNQYVIGHIGRFVAQKNHTFLIDLFYEIAKENPDVILLLVGQGPLKAEIKEKVKKLNLQNRVIFTGQIDNIYEMYQVFDLFIFPSLYEGLGMVLIEAQTAGLHCIASTEVPEIANITGDVEFIDLYNKKNVWKESIINHIKNSDENNRNLKYSEAENSVYNIKNEAEKLLNKYLDNFQKIELFGIPSCGKSYYAKNNKSDYMNLNEKYLYSSNRFIRNIKKITLIVSQLRKCLKRYLSAIKVINKVKFNSFSLKVKMIVYLLSTVALIEKSHSIIGKKVILEEGMLQVLWGLCYNSNATDDFINLYIDIFKDLFLNNIITFKIDDKKIMNRLKDRKQHGGSELEHDIEKDPNCLVKARNIEKKIIELFSKHNFYAEIVEVKQ